jgi:hypothetical protein
MMRHTALYSSAGPGWAVVWNRELADGLSTAVHAHLGAMNRKLTLRAQQMTFCSAGQSPYLRSAVSMRRLPC